MTKERIAELNKIVSEWVKVSSEDMCCCQDDNDIKLLLDKLVRFMAPQGEE